MAFVSTLKKNHIKHKDIRIKIFLKCTMGNQLNSYLNRTYTGLLHDVND